MKPSQQKKMEKHCLWLTRSVNRKPIQLPVSSQILLQTRPLIDLKEKPKISGDQFGFEAARSKK